MRSKKVLYILLFILLFIAMQFMYVLALDKYDQTLLTITLICVLITLILFVSYQDPEKRIKGNYLRIITLFTLSYVIVHFQVYIDLVLGNTSISEHSKMVSLGVINKAALLSLGGLIALFLGYILFDKLHFSFKQRFDSLIYPLWGLKALFVVIFIWFVSLNGESFWNGGYGAADFLSASSLSAYSDVLFGVFFYAVVIINCRNKYLQGGCSLLQYIRSFGLVFNICFVVYLLLVVMSGDRGPIIYFSGAYFVSYVIASRKKYKLKIFIAIGFSAALALTFLGIVRSMDRSQSLIFRFNNATIDSEQYTAQSFSPLTAELAGSVRTLHYAIEYVPGSYSFFYGLFTINSLVSIVPFGGGLIFVPTRYGGSGTFLTWLEQGDHATSGVGTTVVADLYLDFAEYGVYLGLFLFGLLLRKVDLYLYTVGFDKMPLFYAIISIVILSMAIYIPRSSILFNLRSLVWIMVVIISYQFFMRKYARVS